MINPIVNGFLGAGIFDAIAERKPLYIEDIGLPPMITPQEVVELSCHIAQQESHRVKIAEQQRWEAVADGVTRFWRTPKSIDELRKNKTLVTDRLNNYHEKLATVCQLLSDLLGHKVQVNSYLGNNGSNGFGLHKDRHDVIVWQQAGRKRWKYEYGGFTHVHTLSPGSALYLPRGVPHAAQTIGDESLHLTFGFRISDEWAGWLSEKLDSIRNAKSHV